jgi:hypothetical protein
MTIYLNINEVEHQITFNKPIIKDIPVKSEGKIWVIKENTDNIIFSFEEENGRTSKIIEKSENITTPDNILIQRLDEALEKEYSFEYDDVENTENIENSQPIPEAHPYNPDDIKIRRDVYSISDIFNKIQKNDIDLNPDFQRNLVWDEARKSKLIESILLGIPLPVFYFAEDKDGIFHVIDGLQRLNTIKEFMNNQFRLKNLEHLEKLCSHKFYNNEKYESARNLDRKFQRRIENTQLNINIIESSSPSKVKYDIFRRINEGGKPLNAQEIRNCLANNQTRELMKRLSQCESFMLAMGNINDQRMGAQELTLRFTGFFVLRHSNNKGLISEYMGDMNNFLDNTLEFLNNNPTWHDIIEKAFTNAMKNCYYLFNQYCFRKYKTAQISLPKKQPINKALYISWSVLMSNENNQKLMSKIEAGYFSNILAAELDQNNDYFITITNGTSDRGNVNKAFKYASDLIKKHLE